MEARDTDHHDREHRFAFLWIACLTAIISIREFLAPLLRADIHDEDFAHHVWWTYKWSDPELFPSDLAKDFFSLPILAPYGYQWYFRTFGVVFDAQFLAEILPFFLAGMGVTIAFRVGGCIGGGMYGGVIAALYFCFAEIRFLHAGLPRSFATPILLYGAWALVGRRNAVFGFAILLAALFYPPSSANLVLLGVVVVGTRYFRMRELPDQWFPMLAWTLCGMVVLAVAYLGPVPEEIGDKVSFSEAYAMPEFWQGGRNHFFDSDPWHFYFGKRNGLGIDPGLALALSLALVVIWKRFPAAIRPEAWAFVGTSLALFVLAHLMLFSLHYPNRFTLYAVPVFGLFVVIGVATEIRKLVLQYPSFRGLLGRLFHRRVMVALSAAILFGFGVEAAMKLNAVLGAPPDADREAVYTFLKTLPKDTLVASHPNDADNIPLRANRSVLASMETSLALYTGYYGQMADRIAASLAAFHAYDYEVVDRLYGVYGADVFVVNLARYDEKKSLYFKPFYVLTESQWNAGNRKGFILQDPEPERVLFRRGDFIVVRLGLPNNPPS